jgi:hypothetical protein
MRFTALALVAFGIVGFTLSQDISGPSQSPSYDMPIETSSRLSRWHPSVTTPFRSMRTQAVFRHDDISLTLPLDRPCSSGSTTKLQQRETDVCPNTPTPAIPETHSPCATSWYACRVCVPTATSSTTNDFGGRTRRWVAQYASRSNNMGGCSQRVVARFAEPTITARPTPAVADDPSYTTLPICSFNLAAGRYDCPKVASHTALPICSFNLSAGRYDCPTPKVAVAIPTPRIPVPVHSCASDVTGPLCGGKMSEVAEQTTLRTVRTV